MSTALRNLVASKIIGKTKSEKGPTCSASARKAVLMQYADRANDDGSAIFVSKMRISAELEIHRDTVIQATASLMADAIMEIDDSVYPGGKRPGTEGFTYCYRIRVSALLALPNAWEPKCRNSDTLDDGLVAGDEPIGKALGRGGPAVGKFRRARRKVSASPTLKVSELGRQSVGQSDMNYPSRTYNSASRPVFDGRRAAGDPEYAADFRQHEEDLQRLEELRSDLSRIEAGQALQYKEFSDEDRERIAGGVRTKISELESKLGIRRSA